SYRVGSELPPSPIVAMAVGVAAGAADQELWLATASEGLLAFDGKRFRHLRPLDSEHRSLRAVCLLSHGRVLLGTNRAGVLAWDGKNLSPFHPSLTNVPVTKLAGGDEGLWVGTLDRGVLYWSGGQVQAVPNIPDPHVLSLVAESTQRAWVGTALGVSELHGSKNARNLAEGVFARSLAYSAGKLTIGTLDGEILQVSTESSKARPAAAGIAPASDAITSFLQNDDQLLALTSHRLLEVRGGRTLVEAPRGSLTDRNIATISTDPQGRVWVGFFERGLDVFDSKLNAATHFEDDRLFCINRVAHDPERHLTAVATANGLVLFDENLNKKQQLTRADGLLANHIADVAVIPGGLAMATPAGLTLSDASGMRSLYAFHGLVNNHAYSVAQQGGQILVGTLGGLSILEGGVVKASYTTANSPLKHNWISALTRAGNDWYIGTYGAGVYRLDEKGAWSSYSDLPSKLVINPNAMCASENRVYAGSLGEGLWALDRQSGRWAQFSAGLPSRNVTALAARDGSLYVGTDNGLVRISEAKI
ncbi:MAG TPA: hypothetical protein VE621_11840, partial [Bryobacteraceae bacterium]|nr:hypothetical protein [Bryobacteraceae bacterium]